MPMSLRPQIERFRQLDLFRPRPVTPPWRSLPLEAQRKTLSLLVRLLRLSRPLRPMAGHAEEVGDE
jgi:hypothetical protein